MLLSSSAFSFTFGHGHAHTMRGDGSWISADGNQGDYSVTMEVSPIAEGEVVIAEKVILSSGEEKNMAIRVVRVDDNFFNVFKDDNQIGEGYCFKKDDCKVCHWQSYDTDNACEGTFHFAFDSHEMHRIGSMWQDNVKYIWNDTLTPDACPEESQTKPTTQAPAAGE